MYDINLQIFCTYIKVYNNNYAENKNIIKNVIIILNTITTDSLKFMTY